MILAALSENKVDLKTWQKYQETKSQTLRNQILMEYLYIVTINIKRMSAVYQNRVELEDIVNQGVIALIECIERFDLTKSVQFDSFASIRVRGSIIDYLRKQDWVPRDIRKKSLDINNAYTLLQSKMDKDPTDAEVAEYMGISLADYNDIVAQSQRFALLSYEKLIQENISSIKEPQVTSETPEQHLSNQELRDIIAKSIDKLNEKERLIISLYYYEELKFKEIAVILGLTASRVSQLHAKALTKMEKMLSGYLKN
ncbi:MAG: sigma-70 family RNA polymerase sigma factor [Bacillota bacterium]